jgi:hypothetical protein
MIRHSSRVLPLVIVVGALTAGGIAGAASSTPRLTLADRSPVVVRGTHFKAGENVTVVVIGTSRWTRRAVAAADGTFGVRFGLTLRPCDDVTLQGFGSKGSRARSLPLPRTQCGAAPTG